LTIYKCNMAHVTIKILCCICSLPTNIVSRSASTVIKLYIDPFPCFILLT